MTQIIRVEFKRSKSFLVLFTPRNTGNVITLFSISASMSRISKRTVLINNLTKKKENQSDFEIIKRMKDYWNKSSNCSPRQGN